MANGQRRSKGVVGGAVSRQLAKVARGPWRLYAFLQTTRKHRREFFTIRHFILTPSLCPQVTSIILLAL